MGRLWLALLFGSFSLVHSEDLGITSEKRIEPIDYAFEQNASGFDQKAAEELLSKVFAARVKSMIEAKQAPPRNFRFDYERYLNGELMEVGEYSKGSIIRNPFSVPRITLHEIVTLLRGNVTLDEAWESIGTSSLPGFGVIITHKWRLWLPEMDGQGAAPAILVTYLAQKDHEPGEHIDPKKLTVVAFRVFLGKPVGSDE